jgi:hypothetical protein
MGKVELRSKRASANKAQNTIRMDLVAEQEDSEAKKDRVGMAV